MISPLFITGKSLLVESATIFSIFSPGEFITLLAFLGGMVAQFIWIKVKLAEHEIKIEDIRVRQDEHFDKIKDNEVKGERQSAMLSRELSNTSSKIFEKLDKLTEITGEIRIKCAAHDAIHKNQKE